MKKHYKEIDIELLPPHVKKIINEILKREGGQYTEHPNDWPTKWGIRKLSADRAGYTGRIQDLDRATAGAIWTSLFWYAPNLNLLDDVSTLIAETVIDTSGPAGLPKGISHLQKAIVSFNLIHNDKHIYGPDLAQDGVIGPATLNQLKLYLKHRQRMNGELILATRLNCLQDAHYCNLAVKVPKKRSFSFGWSSKRVFADLMDLADQTDLMIV